jgi:hypothetical protein
MRRVFIALLALACAACKEEIPQQLIVTSGASDVQHSRFRGMNHITYKVNEAYPARRTLQEISSALEKQGWSPLQEDFFHPGKPSSHAVGWAFYEDAKIRSFIYEWAGDWKDQNNNVLTYWFRYNDNIEKYKKSTYILKPSSSKLTVIAIYMPDKIAQAKRLESIKEQESQKKTGTTDKHR